jgi:hypothetical protein
MGTTPDRHQGESDEEGTVYENLAPGNDPPALGGQRMVNGDFRMRDQLGVFNPRTASNAAHRELRHLIHFIDDGPALGFASGAFKETLPSADPFPTSEIWWESAAKTEKIVELAITRDAQKKPTTEVWQMYDTDGVTVLETVTDTIAYTGPFETTRTRAIA